MAFNPLQKLAGNIAAIRIALDWDGKRPITAAEMDVLKGYAGFGGLKAVLLPAGSADGWRQRNASQADMRLYLKVMELHDLVREKLDEKTYAAAVDALQHSTQTAFYTPELVPRALYAALTDQRIKVQRLYEPSAGAGIFNSKALPFFDLKEVSAVEKDFLTAKILAARCSALPVPATVQAIRLEKTDAGENGRYDLVVSNIPFGNFTVFDPAYSGNVTDKIHNYFFDKGLDKLGDGGIMAYLTTDAFLNTPGNTAARKHLFTSADFIAVAG